MKVSIDINWSITTCTFYGFIVVASITVESGMTAIYLCQIATCHKRTAHVTVALSVVASPTVVWNSKTGEVIATLIVTEFTG
jgi:hypothetical protein